MLPSNDDLASWVAEDFFRLTFDDDRILGIRGAHADGFARLMAVGDLTVRKLR